MTAATTRDSVLTITAHSTAPTASCPRCGASSQRIHRYDTRRPRDLPLWDDTVCLVLHVRRFRCLNTTCPVQTFAERLPQVVRPAAQRTVRLTAVLQQLGLALGGEAGARLGAARHVPTSPDTLLRLIRQLPDPHMATPSILGVDDWAMRRGHTDGTLLVDLERHRPVDLWPDRTADTLAAWLRTHPGVTILSRDRSTEYARGATLGAPDGPHVLDRWHLIRHRREALERRLDRLHQRLAAMMTVNQPATPLMVPSEARSLRRSTTDHIARQERRARRVARYQAVQALHAQGVSKRQMARQLHMSRTTVIRYLRTGAFPERAQSRRVSLLDPDVAYLQKRWDAGCHNGAQLWREIHALGFAGTRRMVSNWVVRRRELGLGHPSARGRRPAFAKEPVVHLRPVPDAVGGHLLPAPRQLVWLLLRPEETLMPSDQELLQTLRQDKELETASTLTQRFRQMMRQRTAAALDPWLADGLASRLPELVNFASGLQREHSAVQAALELPYSHGQVEGQMTKLTRLKRQSYGRAKLDLLRLRMLHAA